MTGAIISVVSLLIGTFFGILFTCMCVVGKSKNVITNADRLALDTERLANALYDADDCEDACTASWIDGNFITCDYQDEDGNCNCKVCIKEWLEKEVDVG